MGSCFPLGMEETYLIGIPTLLDLRFKKAAFTNRSATERMSWALLNEVVALYQRSQVPDTGSPTSNEPTAPALNGHDGSCDTDSASFQPYIIPRQKDPLQWWRNNKHAHLSAKVTQILMYFSYSAHSEHLFSKAGELVIQKRSSII